MSDGTLSVRRRQPKASEGTTAHRPSEASLRATTLESFLGGAFSDIGLLRVGDRTRTRPVGDVDEFKVESKRRRRLKVYDRYLKGFKYFAALDSALQKVGVTFFVAHGDGVVADVKLKKVPPATTFALIQELLYRDGLRSALAGRDDVLLEPILRFLLKYITDPRFGNTVCDVTSLIIGVSHFTTSITCVRF